MRDKELIKMASWSNTTIIITSRLSELSGYDTSFEIENLGDASNSKKCIQLFYHYNPKASNRDEEADKYIKKALELYHALDNKTPCKYHNEIQSLL